MYFELPPCFIRLSFHWVLNFRVEFVCYSNYSVWKNGLGPNAWHYGGVQQEDTLIAEAEEAEEAVAVAAAEVNNLKDLMRVNREQLKEEEGKKPSLQKEIDDLWWSTRSGSKNDRLIKEGELKKVNSNIENLENTYNDHVIKLEEAQNTEQMSRNIAKAARKAARKAIIEAAETEISKLEKLDFKDLKSEAELAKQKVIKYEQEVLLNPNDDNLKENLKQAKEKEAEAVAKHKEQKAKLATQKAIKYKYIVKLDPTKYDKEESYSILYDLLNTHSHYYKNTDTNKHIAQGYSIFMHKRLKAGWKKGPDPEKHHSEWRKVYYED